MDRPTVSVICSFILASLASGAFARAVGQAAGPHLTTYLANNARVDASRDVGASLPIRAQLRHGWSLKGGAAQLAFGLAGTTAGFAATRALSLHRAPTVVGAAAGAIGGVVLGGRAGGCRTSLLGAVLGATANALVSYTAGAIVARGEDPEGWGRSFAYVGMVPFTFVGAQLRW